MVLEEDFDLTNQLWVFSGRRGVHCWVCDPEARSMNNDMRGAVVNYMSLNIGNEKAERLHLTSPMHPHLVRSYKHLAPHFEKVIIEE